MNLCSISGGASRPLSYKTFTGRVSVRAGVGMRCCFVFSRTCDMEKFTAQCHHAAHMEVFLRITDSKRSNTSFLFISRHESDELSQKDCEWYQCIRQAKSTNKNGFGQRRNRRRRVQELSNQVSLSSGFSCGLDLYMSSHIHL